MAPIDEDRLNPNVFNEKQIPKPAKTHHNSSSTSSNNTSNSNNIYNSGSSTNPYNNLSTYSHEATTIPPYVLYSIANNTIPAEVKQQQLVEQEKNIGTREITESISDPFISSLNNNWGVFLDTMDNTPAYAQGVLNQDKNNLNKLPDLSGSWGGDERLKQYLDPEEFVNLQTKPKGWWFSGLFRSESNTSTISNNSEKHGISNKNSRSGRKKSNKDKNYLFKQNLERLFLYNNYIPLIFRICIFIFSIISLALSSSIFRNSKGQYQLLGSSKLTLTSSLNQQPSTIMAICVQTVALVYLVYIAYDEFSSKPLGIRDPIAKIRLILLDLLFIIFSSANLSLSFNTLYDGRWVCTVDSQSVYPIVDSICNKQKALCAFLFLVLTLWVSNFTISVLRVVEKVSYTNSPR